MGTYFPPNGAAGIQQGFKIAVNDEQMKMGHAPVSHVFHGPSTIYMGVFGQPGEYTINVGHVAQRGQVGAVNVAGTGSRRITPPPLIRQNSPAIVGTPSPTINNGDVGVTIRKRTSQSQP